MKHLIKKIQDKQIEYIMGMLLAVGVLVSGLVVLFGGIIYLYQHEYITSNYNIFIGEPERLRNLYDITKGAFQLRGRELIQFGLVLLIATPVARVIFAVIGFYLEKDRLYTIISAIVLIVLLLSLLAGVGK
jgi:uncharacterized membrane protein